MRLAYSGGSLPGTRGVQTLFDGEDSLLQTVVKSCVYVKA
jgi:hypothetical protein